MSQTYFEGPRHLPSQAVDPLLAQKDSSGLFSLASGSRGRTQERGEVLVPHTPSLQGHRGPQDLETAGLSPPGGALCTTHRLPLASGLHSLLPMLQPKEGHRQP